MEPENEKPEAAESRADASKAADPAAVDPTGREPRSAGPDIVNAEAAGPDTVVSNVVQTKIVQGRMNERRFAQTSRRELLKMVPVLALGAFAIPSLQESLLKNVIGFSDWASGRLFRRGHLAPTFADAQVTRFEKFPINDYDVDDPGVIFENWSLTVSGAVQKPGDYKLAQIQVLPRVRQNTRHVCVEGWDVIGRFGGARLSDFLNMIGADT